MREITDLYMGLCVQGFEVFLRLSVIWGLRW